MSESITKEKNVETTTIHAKAVKPPSFKENTKTNSIKYFANVVLMATSREERFDCTKLVYEKIIKQKLQRDFHSDFLLEVDDKNTIISITSIPKEDSARNHFNQVDTTNSEGLSSNKVILQVHENDSVSVKYAPSTINRDILSDITNLADSASSIQVDDFLGDKYMVTDIRSSSTSKYIHVDPRVS